MSAAKRARPASEGAQQLQLNVGGVTFATRKETLTLNSHYFKELLASENWEPATDGELFLDRDPESFRILLNCMRLRSTVPLPCQSNPELAKTVLMEAEFFGVEWLLAEVKERALRNTQYGMTPSDEPLPGVEDASSAFDDKFGGIEAAIHSGVLPGALHGRRKSITSGIKQLLPAITKQHVNDWVVFYRAGEEVDRMPPLCYALVESDGAEKFTHIEPIIVTRNTRVEEQMQVRLGDPNVQFLTASDWLHPGVRGEPEDGEKYDEWGYEQVLHDEDPDEDDEFP